MQVGVRVEEEDVKTGIRHHCCSAYLTFVSVWARPSDGRAARPLPRLEPTKDSHKGIYEAAEKQASCHLPCIQPSKKQAPQPKLRANERQFSVW